MSKLKGVDKLSVLVELVMFTFRLFFYVFVIDGCVYGEGLRLITFSYQLYGLVVIMVVPICFWIPLVFKRSTYFCFAELLLNGSLTIYAMMHF